MDDRPLKGVPVREGVSILDGSELVVWQQHLWNTGECTRVWFVKPDENCATRIVERNIRLPVEDPE